MLREYPYKLCYKDVRGEELSNSEDPGVRSTEHFRFLLFQQIGKIRRGSSDGEWSRLKAILKRFARHKQANPAAEPILDRHIQSEERQDGGVPIESRPISSSHSLPIETTTSRPSEDSAETGRQSNSVATTLSNTNDNSAPMSPNQAVLEDNGVEDWRYTSELKEYCDQFGVTLTYKPETIKSNPPYF